VADCTTPTVTQPRGAQVAAPNKLGASAQDMWIRRMILASRHDRFRPSPSSSPHINYHTIRRYGPSHGHSPPTKATTATDVAVTCPGCGGQPTLVPCGMQRRKQIARSFHKMKADTLTHSHTETLTRQSGSRS
jgi:hypothetical protein